MYISYIVDELGTIRYACDEFNDISKCYRHNNILITIKERYDNWNEFHVCDIMGYWVGNKNG